MKTLLRIDSSLSGENSTSKLLADESINSLQRNEALQITYRDITTDSIPHLNHTHIAALSTPHEQHTPEQQTWLDYADSLINEVIAADTLLIGAPMYNFGVPSVLKSWFDHIARAGVTFRYTSEGPEGLLKNKQAIIITTRGGIHRNQQSDSETHFITTMLNFLGIKKINFIYAEGLNMGNGERDAGLAEARQQIQQLSNA